MSRHIPLWCTLLLVAGCVSSTPPAPPPGPGYPTTPAGPGPYAPAPAPQPGQPAPQPQTPTGDMAFDAWRADFLARAPAQWRPILERELRGVTPDARAITSDLGQPEFSRPISQYVAGAASAQRIANGRSAWASVPELPAIEAKYGVPAEVLVAIWGMESAYGQIKGEMDVFRSLATLAAQGRRRAWAETQLISAARMIGEGHATRAQMKGSWAGAMGHTQFIPESYLTHAQDGDGDGDRDVWNSPADALASAAQLLRASGWRPGVSWHQEVSLPSQFDYSLAETRAMTAAEWSQMGVRRAVGGAWSTADASSEARVLLPAGARGPAFMVFPNHFAIRGYNNSIAYALGIGTLADALRGAGGLQTPWPTETPLSLADRRAAQAALAQLGFDPGGIDGVVGTGTRAALRRWQQARNRPADGYLDAATIAALRREAGL